MSCSLFTENEENINGPSPGSPIYPQAYSDISVGKNGEKILFTRNKITRLSKNGFFSIDLDSSGIYMADIDGNNMEFLIQGSDIGSPNFSSNMDWILFERGGQLYRVEFHEGSTAINLDSIVQLTTEGNNYFPALGKDDIYVTYVQADCSSSKECGLWMFNVKSDEHQIIARYGNQPTWHPDNDEILYLNRIYKESGEVLGDSIWVYSIDNKNANGLFFIKGNYENRNLEYSPNFSQIVFQSGWEVFQIELETEEIVILIQGGGFPAWSSSDEIIYIKYEPHNFSYENGTIWSMNSNTGKKKQLTFNHEIVLVN